MDTAPVARDIIEIFERHGEWRQAESERLLSAEARIPETERTAVTARNAYHHGKEMVQYWGFVSVDTRYPPLTLISAKSYGSILGATLAAMYPDRIKRAVLDGVADSHDCRFADGRLGCNFTD